MDFLKIRKKARERAAAREAEAAAEGGSAEAPAISAAPSPPTSTATATPAPRTAAPAPGSDDAALRDAEEIEGALVARLGGPPAPEDGFLTWRPGSGPSPRPRLDPAPTAPEPAVAPPEDFRLVSPAPAPEREAAPPAERLEPAARPVRAPLDEFFYRPDEEAPEVPAVGAAVEPESIAELESMVREEYLTFLLGREEYAVAIERVREVVKAPPVTEVPRAPAHITGVVTVRGEVVAVLDPRRRLGLPGAPPGGGAARIVIVDAGEGPCALLVDAVASVVRLPRGSIEPCPQGIGGARAEFLAGIGRDGDRLFTVLDLGALLRRAPPGGARRGEEELRAGS